MHKYFVGYRRFTLLSLVTFCSILFSSCVQPQPGGGSSAAPAAAGGPIVNSVGVQLPDDAAPLEQQIFRVTTIEGKHFDATRNIYETNGMQGTVWEPLVWLDADFKAYPGGADSWETSADGLTWSFHLRKTAKWSDGTPITADDWVFSIQRMLSPEVANPYGWFYASIKNADKVQKGEVPVTDLGVAKADDYTLQITTETPIPYFLQVMGFTPTIAPKHMIDKLGNGWADTPETALSNGPFIIKEWNKGKDIVYVPNPQYDGPFKPKVEQVIATILPQADTPLLPMFQAGEIDSIVGMRGADLSQALADPDLKDNIATYPAFTTFYMFFDQQNPPFNDLKVRQAFSHAIDRESISKQVMQGLEVPAVSMLPSGFPCSQADNPDVRAIQAYDPAKAKQLLADAGFPDGKGFPALELWTRQGQIVTEAEAIQRMLSDNLGITVTPKDNERSLFMDKLRAYQIPLGVIQWAQDYSDPTNFLDWWASGSRHNWKNQKFIDLVNQARGELDVTKRCQMYNEAEKILIEDVGGVFIGHPVEGTLWSDHLGGVRASKDGLRRNSYLTWVDVYIKK
jgi:peptide/nickel transport system substrate-binding protein/oligopeptide transport system substrate-binding protein